MSNSLFDQLKKAGLADEKKAKQVKQEKYNSQKQQLKQQKGGAVDEAKLQARRAQVEKVERDRQLNQQRKEEVERKAIAAQIKQLIETNRISEREGDLAYHFTDGSKVKTIYITEALQRQLSKGWLAIVRLAEGYELVPAPVAEKIRQRDEGSVIMANVQTTAGPDEDDSYADYQIPDDLMW